MAATTQAPPPAKAPKKPARTRSASDEQPWYAKLARSRYFFGALFLHVIIFFLVATLVIFPAFKPPQEDFNKTYIPSGAPPPPPPPPPDQTVPVPTAVAQQSTTITSANTTASFSVIVPDITPSINPTQQEHEQPQKIQPKTNAPDNKRIASIMHTEANWGRDRNNIMESGGDPHNVKATFPVYLASYADGDWNCNVEFYNRDGKITGGSLPNLVQKINEWSHGSITGSVVPDPLDIGGPELLAKTPPFIFFTGHKDFVLTDQEVQNLRDYLQVGGMIWGDSALAGLGSRFDVAFHREMKRVVPDIDKNFEPVDMNYDIFTKSWYPMDKLPSGMNNYAEPIQHLDIDGKLAILYTPNDYSDMFQMLIEPGDQAMGPLLTPITPPYLHTNQLFWDNSRIFFRNFTLPSCIACDQLGMNIVAYALVRFDKDLLLAPP
jgi:hypothetical protein